MAWNSFIVSEQTLHNIPKHNVFQIKIQPISGKSKVTSPVGIIICANGSGLEKMLNYKIKHQNYVIYLWGFMLSLMKRKEKLLGCLGKCCISLIITLANINRTLNHC